MRQLQLPAHPLLAEVALDQARVLDRRADLIRDGGDELAVTRGERVFAGPVGQIDDADGRGDPARGRVDDRDREKRETAVGSLDGVWRLLRAGVGGVVTDYPHLAEDARGNRPRIIHFDRRHIAQLHAAGGDETQDMAARIVHQQRRAARADHRRNLAQDSTGGLIQPDRVAEDLADRVDQVDFLVAPRQLGRDLGRFLFRLQHRADDVGELGGGALPASLYLEPGIGGGGNRLEHGGPVGSLRTAFATQQTQRCPRKRREHRQQTLEPCHPARSVRQMPLPFSLNATSSTRWRMTNNPRPYSRSRLSGCVGSGSRLVSKPWPSSTT